MCTMKKTNILVITSDQQRFDFLGKINPAIETPNLDRLANEGILCTSAYTPSPTCTPARASLLTGQYPSKHGAYTIGTKLDESYPTLPGLLSTHGYATALIGKAHFQPCLTPGSFESAPHVHDYEFFKNWRGPYYGFEHAELVIGHTSQDHSCGMNYGAWLREQHVDIDSCFQLQGKNKHLQKPGVWNLPEAYHPSKWTADRSIAYIDNAECQNRPFFMWTSFQDPHNPYIAPEPWATMYNPDDIALPLRHPEESKNKPFFYDVKDDGNFRFWDDDYIREYQSNIPHSTYRLYEDPATIKKAIAINMGMVSLMDKYIGKIIDHLKAKNIYDNTAIFFTSDHGDYLGNHGMWFKGMHAYDDCQKIPFIAKLPDSQKKNTQSDTPINLVDIAPTCCRLAGIPEPIGYDGIDQSEVLRGAKDSVRDWTIIEYRAGETPFMQKTLVTAEYKLVVYKNRPFGELYHRKKDPDQMNNLWDRPDFQSVKVALFQKLISAEMEKETVILPRTSGA